MLRALANFEYYAKFYADEPEFKKRVKEIGFRREVENEWVLSPDQARRVFASLVAAENIVREHAKKTVDRLSETMDDARRILREVQDE